MAGASRSGRELEGSTRGGGGLGGRGGRRPPSSRRDRLARRAGPSGSSRVKAGTAPGGRGAPTSPPPPHWACGARWAPRRSCRGCSRRRWRTRRRCQVRGTGTCWPGTRAGRRAAGGVPALLAPRGPRAQGRTSIGARLSGRGAPGTPGRTRGGERGQAARREGGGAAPPGVSPRALEGGGKRALRAGRGRAARGELAMPEPRGARGLRLLVPDSRSPALCTGRRACSAR